MQVSTKWYAIHLHSNREHQTAQFLQNKNIEIFLPTYEESSRRTDRTVTLKRPLFPGYLFARLDIQGASRVEILKAPGVVRIVGFTGQAAPIPEQVIESIRIVVGGADGTAKPHPLVKAGREVTVTEGPFKGAVGVLSQSDNRKADLVVEVEFLGRAVSVPISPDQVKPVF